MSNKTEISDLIPLIEITLMIELLVEKVLQESEETTATMLSELSEYLSTSSTAEAVEVVDDRKPDRVDLFSSCSFFLSLNSPPLYDFSDDNMCNNDLYPNWKDAHLCFLMYTQYH